MFHHVTIRVSDRDASERFLRTVLSPLGIASTGDDGEYLQFRDLSIAPARRDRPLTTGLHVGLLAPTREAVDASWRAAVAAGYESDGEPGPRPEYSQDYYGAFLRDPDSNSIEAMLHGNARQGGGIVDHLWVRVADAAASADFYAALSPTGGFSLAARNADRVRFRGTHGGSITFVEGAPRTSAFHFAVSAPDAATVEAFHRAALAAGGRDNGAPGLRPEYGATYFGAFALDPDGHNVEAVTGAQR